MNLVPGGFAKTSESAAGRKTAKVSGRFSRAKLKEHHIGQINSTEHSDTFLELCSTEVLLQISVWGQRWSTKAGGQNGGTEHTQKRKVNKMNSTKTLKPQNRSWKIKFMDSRTDRHCKLLTLTATH